MAKVPSDLCGTRLFTPHLVDLLDFNGTVRIRLLVQWLLLQQDCSKVVISSWGLLERQEDPEARLN